MSLQPSDPLDPHTTIRVVRLLRGLRLSDVAAAAGFSIGYLNALEHGRARLTPETAAKLYRALSEARR